MDALRAEFPSAAAALASVRRPSVARTGIWWALLAGVGAAFVVRALFQILVAALWPVVFPATAHRPDWLVPSLIWDGAAEIAAGLVLVRSGGIPALGLYVGVELLILVAALPGRLFVCSRARDASLGLGPVIGCDLPSLIAERWPLWLALAVGALAFRLLARRDGGEDTLLRAAGAFGAIVTVVTTAATTGYYLAGAAMPELTVNGVYAVGQIAAGLVAGALLWRRDLARPLLFALCLVGPAFALSIPTIRAVLQAASPAPQPASYYLALWAGVVIPAGGAIALFAGRALRREWGTFS